MRQRYGSMSSSASKTKISVSIGSVPFNFRTGTAALNKSAAPTVTRSQSLPNLASMSPSITTPAITHSASPTISRSQSLPNLASLAPTITTPVSAAETSRPLPWYQCEFEDEDDWLDDEERELYENAQWGEPIVFKEFVGVSQLQALLQAK